jgi:hypothetical protein
MIFAFVCFFVVSIFGEESKLHFCDGSGLFFFYFFLFLFWIAYYLGTA